MSGKAKQQGVKRKAEEEAAKIAEDREEDEEEEEGEEGEEGEDEEEEGEKEKEKENDAAAASAPAHAKPAPELEVKAEVKPKLKVKAKRAKKDKSDAVKVGSLIKADFVLPDRILQVAGDPLKGLHFATAGVLITKESARYSFYLGEDDLKQILKDRGAAMGMPSRKTDIYIEGDLIRMCTKRGDVWSGSNKQLALYKQLDEQEPPLIMSFDQFMSWFNLEKKCFLESKVAEFDADASNPPGSTRSRGCMSMKTLKWMSGPRQGQAAKPKHNPYTFPYVRRLEKLGKAQVIDDDEDEGDVYDDDFGDCG